ncbi:maleylpyruvate isomerase N-terminal domain-containing protein [Longispora sp. K20-0274]|uniref:maleylpyruvate isomerase N-terminal domain-containing protein n=1 Tax=Longispora sp. K20-0274 TaxID=3088255 RepID=UPI00399AF071
MTEIREAFLRAADIAVHLLAEPAVAAAWEEPSALAEFTVGSLSGHLAAQILFVPVLLAEPVPAEEVVDLPEFYARSRWIDAPPEDEFNFAILRGGAAEAADGPAALVARAAGTMAALRSTLAGEPDRPVRRDAWVGYALTLDDFLLTRMMELVVHADDLTASVGLPLPEFPAEVAEPVVDLLTRLAVRRHGLSPVLRALTRAERAPATVTAF